MNTPWNSAKLVTMLMVCCASDAFSQTLLWDHADVRNTSFVIRRTSNVTQHWTNWPVIANLVHLQ